MNYRIIKRRKQLAVAASAVAAAVYSGGNASADTINYLPTGSGNWTTASNWQDQQTMANVVPGPTDIAVFPSTVANGSSITLNFSTGNIFAGAIVDNEGTAASGANSLLTFVGNTPTGGSLYLTGQTVTVPFNSVTTTETYPNVVIASTSSSTAQNKNLTFNSSVNLVLNGSSNTILGYSGQGSSSKVNNNAMPIITISGNISNGSLGAAGLTFLGGGNEGGAGNASAAAAVGGELNLGGVNTFTGGLTIGTPNGAQGGTVDLLSPAALPTTGNITVYEGSQLAFVVGSNSSAPTIYGGTNQTLILNGIGQEKTISGAIRPTGGTAAFPIEWAGNISLGSSFTGDLDNGYVLTTVASGGSDFKVLGNIVGPSTGGLIEQGGGLLELAGRANNYGATQIGNGGLTVDAGGSISPGDIYLFQTSTNNPLITLNNTNPAVANLKSSFTASNNSGIVVNAGGYIQSIILNGINSGSTTTLTINQTNNQTFGYGATIALTSGIADGSTLLGSNAVSGAVGAVVYNGASGAVLTLSGPNSYTGGTTIRAGKLSLANLVPGNNATDSNSLSKNSALGSGTVTVLTGATLATGGFTAPTGFNGTSQTTPVVVTSGALSGLLQVSSGGIVSPGNGAPGSLYVGSLNAAAGSLFNLNIQSAAAGNYSTIVVGGGTGPINLDSTGVETINITGSTLAVGSFNLVSGVISGSTSFVRGTTPNGPNRTYTLSYNTNTSTEILSIINTGTERDFSTTGTNPAQDGSGSFGQGATNFFQSTNGVVTNNATYNNADNFDTAFGDGGTGGQVTILSGGARVGGTLILGQLQAGSFYTFGTPGGTNAITTVGGVFANNSALVNAPVILGGSQPWAISSGNTVILTGGVSESVTGSQLTITGSGSLAFNGGTGSYTGGTNISGGTLQTTSAALPGTGTIANNGALVFDQIVPGTTGFANGLITGTGTVTVQDTGTVNINNSSNSYTGQTIVSGGTLGINSIGDLGTGAGGILLTGGTLLANANLTFPASTQSPKVFLTLAAGTTSTVNASGHAITFGQLISGSGNINITGGGSVTLTGVPSTTVIGQVAVGSGTQFIIAPPALTPSFGFGFSSTPGTVQGNIVVATPIELRLQGGLLDGGGNIVIQPAGMLTVAKFSTTISGGSGIVLPSNIPGNSESIGSGTGQIFTINGVISGGSSVDFTSGNITSNVSLGAVNTYTGSTIIDQPVGLGINNALPNTDVSLTNSGLFDLNGYNQSIASLVSTKAGSIVQNSGNSNSILTITGTSSTTYQGVLQNLTFGGTLGLTLNATGSLALTNASSYSGPINILDGRLQITIADPTSGTGLGDPAVINIGGGSNASNAQLDFSGVGNSSNTTTISYTAATILNITVPVINLNSLGGFNTGSGINTGAIRVSGGSYINLPDNIVFNANSAITTTGTSQLTLSGNLSGTGTFISNGNGLTTLTGSNSGYTGGTEVDAGTLNIASGSLIGSGPLTVTNTLNSIAGSTGNATIVNFLNGGQTVGSLSGTITPASTGTNTAVINLPNSGTLTVNQTTDGIYAGTLNGAGASIYKAGPNALTIGGNETYTGTTTVAAGTLTIGNNAGPGIFDQISSGVTIAGGSKLALAFNTTHNTRTLLTTTGLTFQTSSSILDVGDNDLQITGGSLNLATVTAEIASGYNLVRGANWSGGGITSSAAAANTQHLTALGVIQNNQNGPTVFTTFDGVSVSPSDILVKYTYFGDANLDGKVDGSDYSLIDSGYASHGSLTGWYNGDFNYDGVIDGSDYALVDNAFNNQTQSLSSAALVATQADQVAGPTSAVPEPTTLALLAAVSTLSIARRHRGKNGK